MVFFDKVCDRTLRLKKKQSFFRFPGRLYAIEDDYLFLGHGMNITGAQRAGPHFMDNH